MADDRTEKARPSLSRQLLPAVHGLLARPLSSYYLLIASAGMLLLIGLTMVFSATSVRAYAANGNAFSDITSQAVFALLGLVAFWVCQRLPAITLRTLGKYVLGTAILLLCLLDLLNALKGLHVLQADANGVVRAGPIKANLLWLYLGGIGIQPSELAKLGMVLWGADVIARKGPALGHWRELAMPLFPVVGLLFVLVGYNDVGTMLVLLALIVGLLWAAGVRLRVFGALGVLGLAGIGLLIAAASRGAGSGTDGAENYRVARLTAFLKPLDKCDLDGACYQLIMGRSAIFEGGWFGVGLGKGALKWGWVPEAENDFIYSILAEELGVVGCTVVLALFSVLAYSGFRIARRSADPFRRLAAASITTWLVAQAVINMGGVVGLLPITGLPLPFISAGGSALVVAMAAVGMLASFARAEPDAARALNARPTPRWVRLVWAPLPPLPSPRRPAAEPVKKSVKAGDGRRR
ncbi:putative peptidoglycan glycosyltransferase FtsW [Actinoplanes oblitus]|uniref:Probable peptidoglycan glycosyltransferase FtsW n=1 Tax=Actinoplanes oblitus TaxID=3040509 RepID=A0ABY8WJS6_9ACTN|nr:putative peptidoglycan glycosyltransferase FtsW [Actinoplanes oblitus]WIM98136.1 putative peptidoglycan glycosyltransferase FtsW [Actinoplanes oblitus]